MRGLQINEIRSTITGA